MLCIHYNENHSYFPFSTSYIPVSIYYHVSIKEIVYPNCCIIFYLYRTDSVAEKLLADWLAFNLYTTLKDQIGSTLYTLYRAIKSHLENAPIDVLTGEATNSLSEDKLLKMNIQFEVS